MSESEQFRINSGVRQGHFISSWLIDVYMDICDGGSEDGDWLVGCEFSGGWEKVEIAWPLVRS